MEIILLRLRDVEGLEALTTARYSGLRTFV